MSVSAPHQRAGRAGDCAALIPRGASAGPCGAGVGTHVLGAPFSIGPLPFLSFLPMGTLFLPDPFPPATPPSPWGTSSLWKPTLGTPFSWGAVLHGKPASSPQRLSYPGEPFSLGTSFCWRPPFSSGAPSLLGDPPSPWKPPAFGDPPPTWEAPLGDPPWGRQRPGPPAPSNRPPSNRPGYLPPPSLATSSSRLPSLAGSQSPWRETGATCRTANRGKARTLSSPPPSSPSHQAPGEGVNLPAGPHVELGRARFLRGPGRQAQQGGGHQCGPQPPAAPPAGRRHLRKEARSTAGGRGQCGLRQLRGRPGGHLGCGQGARAG